MGARRRPGRRGRGGPSPAAPRAGEAVAILEAGAASGEAVFVEYDPTRRVWLCALTDEADAASGVTLEDAVAGARGRVASARKG
jgi:hypothetical protein